MLRLPLVNSLILNVGQPQPKPPSRSLEADPNISKRLSDGLFLRLAVDRCQGPAASQAFTERLSRRLIVLVVVVPVQPAFRLELGPEGHFAGWDAEQADV